MSITKPRISPRLSRHLGMLAGAVLCAGTIFSARPAEAWWRGGVWISLPPVVVGPPAYAPYYYPPAYYPPPNPYPYPYSYPAYPAQPGASNSPPPASEQQSYPAYPGQPGPSNAPPPASEQQSEQQSAPSDGRQVAYGTTCYAGVYVCPAPSNTPVGAGCSCPALGAPSYGTVR